MAKAATLSHEILDTDIIGYYGHMQCELTIEPMLIILNQKFDHLLAQFNNNGSTEENKHLSQEVKTMA